MRTIHVRIHHVRFVQFLLRSCCIVGGLRALPLRLKLQSLGFHRGLLSVRGCPIGRHMPFTGIERNCLPLVAQLRGMPALLLFLLFNQAAAPFGTDCQQ